MDSATVSERPLRRRKEFAIQQTDIAKLSSSTFKKKWQERIPSPTQAALLSPPESTNLTSAAQKSDS